MFGFLKGYKFNRAEAALAVRIKFLRLYQGDKILEEGDMLTDLLNLYMGMYYGAGGVGFDAMFENARKTLIACANGAEKDGLFDYLPTLRQLSKDEQIGFIDDLICDEVCWNWEKKDIEPVMVNFIKELLGFSFVESEKLYRLYRVDSENRRAKYLKDCGR